MLELPETMTLSKQIAKTFRGKTITRVIANKSPHAMAWFTGDPQSYAVMLEGKRLEYTVAVGGFVKAMCGTTAITFQDGIGLRAYSRASPSQTATSCICSLTTAAHLRPWCGCTVV